MKNLKKYLFCFCIFLLFSIFVFIPFYAKSQEPDSRFGINAFVSNRYNWNEWSSPVNILKDMNISWSREEFVWNIIEPVKGKYNFEPYDRSMGYLKDANINVLGILDYSSNWASTCPTCENPDKYMPNMEEWRGYVGTVVDRYKGQVKYWQIWNEPNVPIFFKPQPDVAKYMDLLKNSYEVIKQKDKDAKVVLAGTSGVDMAYLRMLKDMGGAQYFDVLAVHPYSFDFRTPPEVSFMTNLRNAEKIAEEFNNKPIWLTEFGWPTDRGTGLSEDAQARYLIRTYVMSFSFPNVKKLFWYDFRNDGSNVDYHEHNFGIINQDYSKKKSYYAYSNLIRLLEYSQFEKINQEGQYGTYDFSFIKNGDRIRVIWKINGDDSINLDGMSGNIKVYDYLGGEIVFGQGQAKAVTISGSPVFVVSSTLGSSASEGIVFGNKYDYDYVTQSSHVTMKSGEEREVWVKLKNSGTAVWNKNSASPVILGTSRGIDRASVFFAGQNWVGANRSAKTSENFVKPGETGTFSFKVKAPENLPNGVYREYFCPVAEGLYWMKDMGIYWDMVIDNSFEQENSFLSKEYDYQYVGQTIPGPLNNGDKAKLSVSLKNIGTKSWERGKLNLGTSRYRDRVSSFGSGWLEGKRVMLDQESVKPGEVGSFTFEITANGERGLYKEYFRPVLEGVGWLKDIGIYWPIRLN